MVIDPIADFINQLKNASAVRKESIDVPYAKFTFAVAQKLEQAGYLKSVTKRGKKVRKSIKIELQYDKSLPKIQGVERISKPGRRLYERAQKLRPINFGHGALILSTPKGVLTDKEARKEKIGGEALFKIW